MSTHLDPNLAQKIVHEVKIQGVFDEFRKDSIADVDTKPAYLNLRQRVENAVQKFLSEQRWTPDTNKYQLRERLRRHITESGFLDVGVERIVDQVVNPKIGSVFQPRIEEIAYKYLGLPPPVKRENAQMPQIPYPNAVNGNALKIETMPTEPENLLPKDLEQVSPASDKTAVEDEKVDDEEDESPPFESLADCKSPIKTENVESNEVKLEVKTDLEKEGKEIEVKKEIEIKQEQSSPVDNETKLSTPVKDECPSVDGLASQESQLSQVSSDTTSNQLNQSGSDPPTNLENAATANISEEAQMPKFNENSTETEGNTKKISDLHFDIKKDEIKFEGTERKTNLLEGEQNECITDEPPVIESAFDGIEAKSAFNFTKLVKVEPPYNTTQEAASSVSSPDDTSSAQLCIVEKSEQDTNSIQKTLPEESNATTTLNNSQSKVNDEKRKSKTSSSTSSSRHKKSSKSSRRTPDRNHRHDDKDQRERSSKNGSDHRQSDSKHTSKHYQSSTEKHSTSSSKREEKRSSSSRSESQSRHSSSKKDSYRDKHDSKRPRPHKSHRSDKDSYKSRKPSSADDHGEFKEKSRRRKSTDSNDEDKSPSATKNSINNTKSNVEAISSLTTTTQTSGSTKSNNNESNKHSKDHKQNNVPNNLASLPESANINSSKVVVVNEILTDPALGVVVIETKSTTTTATKASKNIASTDEEGELFYFEPKESDHKQRLSLLDEAISRCNFAYKAYDKTQQSDEVGEAANSTNKNNNNEELDQKMKATLQVDCYQYTHNAVVDNDVQTCSTSALAGQQQLADNNEAAAKRFKFEAAECGMSKENEMNEKNAIKTENEAKKSGAPKRALSLTKQRYESEDLYKPRPILGQRIKRRGLDA